jgi:hypothetical protein
MTEKLPHYLNIRNLVTLGILVMVIGLTACGGGDDEEASKARSRAVISAGEIVPAEEVRVAEYLQYYDQFFPEPERDTVGLDLRLGNNIIPIQGGMAWLQIGLQTKSAQTELVAPLNLAIVIDRSGSMNAPDKMPYLKQSLAIFLESLNSDDIVSIVAYSDQAEVLLPSQQVGYGSWIQQVIDRIQPSGATNLHAGMMMGFEEVDRNYDIRRNNRVILLTDGIANRGETDPNEIADDALTYNEKGIYLSTIGLGLEFNDALLSELAHQGKGGYTFVDSAEEMDRVFREHVESLKQRAASDVKVTIVPSSGIRLIGLTGSEGSPPVNGASIPLWPMSTGDNAVILAQLQVGSGIAGSRSLATVELRYFDEFVQRTVTTSQSVRADMAANQSSYDPTWDLEVFRNVTIQRTAEGMQEIDRLFDARQYEAAWRLAIDLEQDIFEVARLTGDSQMLADAELLQKYQQTLANAVWQTENRAPYSDETDTNTSDGQRPYRGDTSTPIPDMPEVEVN